MYGHCMIQCSTFVTRSTFKWTRGAALREDRVSFRVAPHSVPETDQSLASRGLPEHRHHVWTARAVTGMAYTSPMNEYLKVIPPGVSVISHSKRSAYQLLQSTKYDGKPIYPAYFEVDIPTCDVKRRR